MAFPSLMTWLETQWLLGRDDRPHWIEGLFLLGKLVQFSAPLIVVLVLDPGRLRLRRPCSRGMRAGVLFALAGALGTFTLYFCFLRDSSILGDTPAKIDTWLKTFGFDGVGGFLVFAFLMCVPHAFLEEYYWRWFLFDQLAQRMAWRRAALVSGLAFMSHHTLVLAYYLPSHFWTVGLPLALSVALGGYVWAAIYHQSRNLYAPWLSHLLVDAIVITVGWDMAFS